MGPFQAAHLLRSQEQPHLPGALARGESQVEVEDVEGDPLAEGERGVLAAPALERPHREVDVPLPLDGPAGEGGVPVAPLAQRDVVPHGAVGEVERQRQLPRQIQLARAGRPVVHLLQEHEVGGVVGDDLHDALGPEPAIHPDGAVDVVGQDPQAH